MAQPNFNSKDFYANLGLSKDVDLPAIKKAYKKLSLKHHPDKNPNNKEQAEEVFKIISYAYQVLSDPKKRQDYDHYGRDYIENGGMTSGGGGRGGGGFQGHQFHDFGHFNMRSANDIFKDFFGGKDPFESFFDDNEDDFFGGGFGGGMMGGGFPSGFGGGFGGQSGFGGMSKSTKVKKQNRDPFGGFGGGFDDDDFFGGGGGFGGGMMGGGMSNFQMSNNMGGGGNFTSFQSSSFGGMGGGMGESIQQQTIIENGVQKSITKKTKIDSHGNKTSEVIEEFQDPRTGQIIQQKYLENGNTGGGHNMKQIGDGHKKRRGNR